MTTDDILRMAREAGFQDRDGTIRTMHSSGAWVGINEELERFAALVAAEEQARWINAINDEPEFPGDIPDGMWQVLKGDRDAMTEAFRIAVRQTKDAIRARGTK